MGLILLYVFYEVGHVWRKEGVVLGYHFTNYKLPANRRKSSLQQIISQTNHRGCWVTAGSSLQNLNAEKVVDVENGKEQETRKELPHLIENALILKFIDCLIFMLHFISLIIILAILAFL